MYHSEMKHPGKSNTDTIVQENQINAKELTESIVTKISSNKMKETTQSTQVKNASDKKIVALSTDQVDPCKTQLLPIKSELNPTESEFKDGIQKEKEHEMKINEPIEISHAQVPNRKKNENTHSTIEKNELPIEEHKVVILRQINRDRVTIVQGETGCGKSARLPLMLLEDSRNSRIHNRPCRIMVRNLCSSAFFLLLSNLIIYTSSHFRIYHISMFGNISVD